ncbi:MAG TPA: hypothetical protein VN623_11585 [Hyphomicrobium sp.]|nr:hypothetical protein [Hyphomicrobium sp.]
MKRKDDMKIPSNLPVPISKAVLPQAYESAKSALAHCFEMDECKDWADKAQALASYARQAKDESLRKTADRIQARAVRRCGELLKQIPPARGANQNIKDADGPKDKKQTRKDAAAGAGLSERQKKTALRVASVPGDVFESAVDSDSPPTVTALAEIGKSAQKSGDSAAREIAKAAEAVGKKATALHSACVRLAQLCREHEASIASISLAITATRMYRAKTELDNSISMMKGEE